MAKSKKVQESFEEVAAEISQAEEVVAEIIEPEEMGLERFNFPQLLITQHGTPEISSNIDEIDAICAAALAEYGSAVLDEEQIKVAKKIRAALNTKRDEIDAARLLSERVYMAPFDAVKDRVKETLLKIEALKTNLDIQIKASEERQRIEKEARLREHYETFIDLLVPVVPWDRFKEKEWLNLSVTETKAIKEIEHKAETIASDWKSLQRFKDNIKHYPEAELFFFSTFDLTGALAESDRIDALEAERIAKEEAKKAELEKIERMRAEVSKYSQPEAVPENVQQNVQNTVQESVHNNAHVSLHNTQATTREYCFTVTCTAEQKNKIIETLRSMGVSGRFKAL